VKNNSYFSASEKIQYSDEEKSIIVKNAMNGKPLLKNNKKRLKLYYYSAALFMIMFSIVTIWGLRGGADNMHQKSRSNNTNIPGALAPHLELNNRIYWQLSGDQYETIPEGYNVIGKIISAGSDENELKNFESSFGRVGTNILANPANPDSIYLPSDETNGYILFVSQRLRGDIVMYNNKLYGNTGGYNNISNEKPWNGNQYNFVGKIDKVVFDEVPKENFQSNIMDSDKAEVFTNDHTDIIYVKMVEFSGISYIKLTLNSLYD